MVTQYLLNFEAFIWSLSKSCQLNRVPFGTGFSLNKNSKQITSARNSRQLCAKLCAETFKTHNKVKNKQACSPISMRLPGHLFEQLNQTKSALFDLNTHKAAANDTTFSLIPRKAA